MTWLKRSLVVIPLLFLAACYQEERTYTVNPDGTGKVVFDASFPLESAINLSFGDQKEKEPEEKLRDAVRGILEESSGVAAWSDVSFSLSDDENVKFKGTAYFSDINLVELKMGSISSDNLNPVLTRDGDVITIECGDQEEMAEVDEAEDGGKKWEDLSEKEQKAELAKARTQITQMKAMAAGLVGEMKSTVVLNLPSAPSKNTNFKKLGEKSYSIETSGEKMLKAFDALLEDEDLLLSAASSGINLQGDPPDELLELMFDGPGTPQVSFSAKGAPLFDYKKELKAAQDASPAMLKKLGLEIVPVAPMTEGGEFKSLRLGGIRIVTPSPSDDVRPFNWSAGTSLAFVAELPGAVISADEGKVLSITLDNGQNLLSSDKWEREIRGVDLSEDGTWVGFEVNSDRLPKADAKAIKELTGELVCTAATGTKVVDLGFDRLAPGEEGKEFGAKIEELGDHSFHEDKLEVSIHLEIKREMIKDVHFVDPDGVKLKSERNGYSWGGDSGTLTFTCDRGLTDKHQVKLETYSGVTRHVIPFKIEDVPLMPTEGDE